MSNRIVIETDVLKHVRSQMDRLQSELTHLANRLQSIPLDQASGGDLSINATLRLPFSGTVQQGRTISQAIRAYGRGLTATGRQVQRLANALNEAQAEAERAENLLVREIGELATGQEVDFLESEGAMMDLYVPLEKHPYAEYREKMDSLRDANAFWETAYSEKMIQEMSRLIWTDELFDEDAWSGKDSAEREAVARQIADKFMCVFGTEAGVVVLTKENPKRTVTRNGKKYTLSLSNGVAATYNRTLDCIVISVDVYSVESLARSTAHELRHSVQQDIVDASPYELSRIYDIDGTEYDELEALQKELKDDFDSYVSPSNKDQVEKRAKEIMDKRSLDQWWFLSDQYISKDEAREFAKLELEREYYQQLVEVDAMQTGDAVGDAFSTRREMEYMLEDMDPFYYHVSKQMKKATGR